MTNRKYVTKARGFSAQMRTAERNLPDPGNVIGAGGNGLVQVDVAVADLNVEATIGVCADPGFVMYRRSLTTIVG